jgi:hypothetical protein
MRCQSLEVHGAVGIRRFAANHEGGRAERSVLSDEGREKPPQEHIIQCNAVSRITLLHQARASTGEKVWFNNSDKLFQVQVIRLSIHAISGRAADEQISEGAIRRYLHLDPPLGSLPLQLDASVGNGSDELRGANGISETAVSVHTDHQFERAGNGQCGRRRGRQAVPARLETREINKGRSGRKEVLAGSHSALEARLTDDLLLDAS